FGRPSLPAVHVGYSGRVYINLVRLHLPRICQNRRGRGSEWPVSGAVFTDYLPVCRPRLQQAVAKTPNAEGSSGSDSIPVLPARRRRINLHRTKRPQLELAEHTSSERE